MITTSNNVDDRSCFLSTINGVVDGCRSGRPHRQSAGNPYRVSVRLSPGPGEGAVGARIEGSPSWGWSSADGLNYQRWSRGAPERGLGQAMSELDWACE
jgi:hypothetical protein